MATFTNETKSGGVVYDQELLIESTYQLLIGEGFVLKIQEDGDGTTWTSETVSEAGPIWTQPIKN